MLVISQRSYVPGRESLNLAINLQIFATIMKDLCIRRDRYREVFLIIIEQEFTLTRLVKKY